MCHNWFIRVRWSRRRLIQRSLGDLRQNPASKRNNENTTSADWELISINAIPKGLDKLPMGPVTMMRNQLNLVGGTKASYTKDEWAESVRFWQKYAALNPKNENT